MTFVRSLLPALLPLVAACTRMTGAPDDTATPRIKVGVDRAFQDVGLIEHAQAIFENKSPLRLELVYDLSERLAERGAKGELDLLILASDRDQGKLEGEGLASRSFVWGHEELIFIGPAEDPLHTHGSQSAAEMLKNISRSSHLFMKPRPGSTEWVRFQEVFKAAGDPHESASFVSTKVEGVDFVKEVIGSRGFALVRRSAIILAAKEGVKPHRVYLEGSPDLVMRLHVIEIHPAKTKRTPHPQLYDFLSGQEGREIIERYGSDRFGYPPYAPGEPPEGQGARVPGKDQ
jgi:ABC-type tungstate transport system permease subunit